HAKAAHADDLRGPPAHEPGQGDGRQGRGHADGQPGPRHRGHPADEGMGRRRRDRRRPRGPRLVPRLQRPLLPPPRRAPAPRADAPRHARLGSLVRPRRTPR
ncbi:MAG: hypothetical protein ACK55Z_01390, partial [bacterium]